MGFRERLRLANHAGDLSAQICGQHEREHHAFVETTLPSFREPGVGNCLGGPHNFVYEVLFGLRWE